MGVGGGGLNIGVGIASDLIVFLLRKSDFSVSMIIAEYYSGIDGKFVKTHMCKGQKSRCRECKKKLFLCKSCAGVHVPLLGWYPS